MLFEPVLMAQWSRPLYGLQCVLDLTGWQLAVTAVQFLVRVCVVGLSWANSDHAIQLNSRTGTEGPPVSS